MRLAFLIYSNCSKNGPYIVLNVHSMACQLFNCSKNHSVPYPTFFHIEWAWQRELSIQFHIESILNEWHVGPTLFCIEWGAGKPLMCIVFSYSMVHSFVLNSTHGSEMNGGWQTPNVHCLFLYRQVKATHPCLLPYH